MKLNENNKDIIDLEYYSKASNIDISNNKFRTVLILKKWNFTNLVIENTCQKVKNIFVIWEWEAYIDIIWNINIKSFWTDKILIKNALNVYNKNTQWNVTNFNTQWNAINSNTQWDAINLGTNWDALNLNTYWNSINFNTKWEAINYNTQWNSTNKKTLWNAINLITQWNAINLQTHWDAIRDLKNDNFPYKFLPLWLRPSIK